MSPAEHVITKRARSKPVKRDWMGLLIVPVIVAIIVSTIFGTVGYLIAMAKSETRIEKLEKDVDYIR